MRYNILEPDLATGRGSRSLRSKQNDTVKTSLLAKGVGCESLDTDKFKVTEQMQEYVNTGGEIFACGTCLKIRHSEGSEMCPLSTMQDLHDPIKNSDKVEQIVRPDAEDSAAGCR